MCNASLINASQALDIINESGNCEKDVSDTESARMSDGIKNTFFSFSLTFYAMLQYILRNIYDIDDYNLLKIKIIVNFMILN